MIRVQLIDLHRVPYYGRVQVYDDDVVCYHVVGRDGAGLTGPFRYDTRDEAIRAAIRWAVVAVYNNWEGTVIATAVGLDKTTNIADQYGALCALARNPRLADAQDVFKLVEENPDITLRGNGGALEITLWVDDHE